MFPSGKEPIESGCKEEAELGRILKTDIVTASLDGSLSLKES